MIRSLRVRLGSALLAAVYLALPGGAFGVRACQHHDGLPTQATADHDAHAGHNGAASESADSDASHEVCSCLDACAAGSGLVLPSTAAAQPSTTGTGIAPVPAASEASPRAAHPPHFLPFPHGPPAIPG